MEFIPAEEMIAQAEHRDRLQEWAIEVYAEGAILLLRGPALPDLGGKAPAVPWRETLGGFIAYGRVCHLGRELYRFPLAEYIRRWDKRNAMVFGIRADFAGPRPMIIMAFKDGSHGCVYPIGVENR